MADADRFLGVDHGASRSAADVAGPSRSADDFAIPYAFTTQQLDAGRRGYVQGKAEAVGILATARSVYLQNGQHGNAYALSVLIGQVEALELNISRLDPRL